MNKEPFEIFELVAIVLLLAGLSMAVFAAGRSPAASVKGAATVDQTHHGNLKHPG